MSSVPGRMSAARVQRNALIGQTESSERQADALERIANYLERIVMYLEGPPQQPEALGLVPYAEAPMEHNDESGDSSEI